MKNLDHENCYAPFRLLGYWATGPKLTTWLSRCLAILIPFRIFHCHHAIILQSAFQDGEIYMKLLPKYLPGGIAGACPERVTSIRAGQHTENTSSLYIDTLL
jgi:hypothetical protein